MQCAPFVMKLAPILKKCAQARGTKKCNATHLYSDRVGPSGNCVEQCNFKLVSSFSIDPTGDNKIDRIPVCVLLNNHGVTCDRRFNDFRLQLTIANSIILRTGEGKGDVSCPPTNISKVGTLPRMEAQFHICHSASPSGSVNR